MHSKQRQKTGRKPAKTKQAPHKTAVRRYFALLLDHPELTKPLKFEFGGGDAAQTFMFLPSIAVEDLNLSLGILEIDASCPELTLITISEARTVRGSDTTSAVRVLADVPDDFTHWPAPKRNGFFKAFAKALVQLCTPKQCFHREWLAQQFAVHGFASHAALAKVLERTGESALPWPGTVAKTVENWIWKDAAAKWVEKLKQEIKRRQQRNHFLDELHAVMSADWLGLEHPDLAEYVLKAFAPHVHKRPKAYPDGAVVELAGEMLPEPPSPVEAELAHRILASYPAGEGKSLAGLAKAFPSHRHIIAALVEARQLILGPDDYVFTRAQLRSYMKSLTSSRGLDAVPSVRHIKDVLQLERRPAEALRAYLEATLTEEKQTRHLRSGH